jgi:AraC-like DNA-binding protein
VHGGQQNRLSWRHSDLTPSITIRRSTDELAIDDPLIAAAARYIRENACRGATVQEVLRQVPMSRTVLEQKFRRYLGHYRSIVLDVRGNQENTTILGARGAVR